jgi:hypothetical protein
MSSIFANKLFHLKLSEVYILYFFIILKEISSHNISNQLSDISFDNNLLMCLYVYKNVCVCVCVCVCMCM